MGKVLATEHNLPLLSKEHLTGPEEVWPLRVVFLHQISHNLAVEFDSYHRLLYIQRQSTDQNYCIWVTHGHDSDVGQTDRETHGNRSESRGREEVCTFYRCQVLIAVRPTKHVQVSTHHAATCIRPRHSQISHSLPFVLFQTVHMHRLQGFFVGLAPKHIEITLTSTQSKLLSDVETRFFIQKALSVEFERSIAENEAIVTTRHADNPSAAGACISDFLPCVIFVKVDFSKPHLVKHGWWHVK